MSAATQKKILAVNQAPTQAAPQPSNQVENRAVIRAAAGPLRHLLSILALPLMNTVVIPAAIYTAFEGGSLLDRSLQRNGIEALFSMIAGNILLGIGILLVVTSIGLFASRGEGTLAPWDPPRRLVVAGPYRHVRNPMKTGLILVLAAESLILGSAALALWCAIFAIVNVLYIRISEEPGLERRFGAAYVEYCAAVPAWLPRFTPFAAEFSSAAAGADDSPRLAGADWRTPSARQAGADRRTPLEHRSR